MVFNIIESIASTSSRLEKEAILRENADNDILKEVFRLAYDPFTQFYIRKIPKYNSAQPNQADTLDSVISSLAMLSSRQVTGNAAIEYLTKLLSSLIENDSKVLELIIGKDLRCGASASTANKIWPNLIHEYPCMLCSPSDEKTLSKIKWPAMVQLKMDGMRFNAIVKDGGCEFRSRNGKEIVLKGELEHAFVRLADGKNIVFDGELIVSDESGKVLNRQTGNGILNKAVKGTISLDEAKMVGATIWDMIPYEDFKIGCCSLSYKDRFELVQNLPIGGRIKIVKFHNVETLDNAREIFEYYLNQGEEGIILKDLSGKWEDKRVKHQLKFKAELDCDLEVVGYEEGTGKYVGKLGALVCRSRSTDQDVLEVSVGSGFDDASRDSLWNIRNSLVGRIVAVTYNAKITNKQGGISLFLPRFVELREDKDIADRQEDIK